MDSNSLKNTLMAGLQMSPEMIGYLNQVMGASQPQQQFNSPEEALALDPQALQMAQQNAGAVMGSAGVIPQKAMQNVGKVVQKVPGMSYAEQLLAQGKGTQITGSHIPKTQGFAEGGFVLPDSLMPNVAGPMGVSQPMPASQPPVGAPPAGMEQFFSQINQMPQVEMPAAPQAPDMPQQAPQGMDPFKKQYDLMDQMSKAQQMGLQQQANAQQQAVSHAQEQLKIFEQKAQEINSEREMFMNDIRNSQIDPQRYIGTMGGGQRISTAIGLILGGIGGGMTGGPNAALDFLNKQIDNDLKAQQLELGKKENLLAANLKHYGNMADAMKMTQVMHNDYVKHQVDMAVAKSGSQQAKIQGEMLKNQLEQQNAALTGQLAAGGVRKQGQAGPDEMFQRRQLALKLAGKDKEAEAERKQFVPGLGSALTEDDAKYLKEQKGTVEGVKSGLDELSKLGNKSWSSINPNDRAKAQLIKQSLIGALRLPLTGPGAMNEGERALLENIIADPTAVFSLDSNNKTKLKALADRLDSMLGEQAQARGIQGLQQSKGPAKIDFTPKR
jgi:hypothetical protein